MNHTNRAMSPNQQKMFDSLFQQWLNTPESQKFILKQVKDIDQDMGKKYQERIESDVNKLVASISSLEVERRTGNGNELVPPKSPNRKKGKWLFYSDELKVNIDVKMEQEIRILPPSCEVTKTDSGIHFEDIPDTKTIPKFYFPFGTKNTKIDWEELQVFY
jgi:hypothetical protein